MGKKLGVGIVGGVSLNAAATFTVTPLTLNINDAANVGLVIKGAAGQSANLMELQDSASTIVMRVNAAGAGVFAGDLYAQGTKALGAQSAALADASGGATIDAEARTAINGLLARLRTHGLIAT